ncbi:hypothetical protein KX816_18985 [Sphingosinicellaceae bacterium]|nr:hypothetical protein KX816_18985 [Sphingosinicellaceae bacterium]
MKHTTSTARHRKGVPAKSRGSVRPSAFRRDQNDTSNSTRSFGGPEKLMTYAARVETLVLNSHSTIFRPTLTVCIDEFSRCIVGYDTR